MPIYTGSGYADLFNDYEADELIQADDFYVNNVYELNSGGGINFNNETYFYDKINLQMTGQHKYIINGTVTASDRNYYIKDMGVDSDFVFSNGVQTVRDKTFVDCTYNGTINFEDIVSNSIISNVITGNTIINTTITGQNLTYSNAIIGNATILNGSINSQSINNITYTGNIINTNLVYSDYLTSNLIEVTNRNYTLVNFLSTQFQYDLGLYNNGYTQRFRSIENYCFLKSLSIIIRNSSSFGFVINVNVEIRNSQNQIITTRLITNVTNTANTYTLNFNDNEIPLIKNEEYRIVVYKYSGLYNLIVYFSASQYYLNSFTPIGGIVTSAFSIQIQTDRRIVANTINSTSISGTTLNYTDGTITNGTITNGTITNGNINAINSNIINGNIITGNVINGNVINGNVINGNVLNINTFSSNSILTENILTKNYLLRLGENTTEFDYNTVFINDMLYDNLRNNNIEYVNKVSNNFLFKTVTINANWRGGGMSSNGKYMGACINGGNLYSSSDFGFTWTRRGSTNRAYTSYDVNAVGDIHVAGVFGGLIYISLDYGINFNGYASTQDWVDVRINAVGDKLVGVPNNGNVFVSNDYGLNWTQRNFSKNWRACCISGDGKIIYAQAVADKIYRSIDNGLNWVTVYNNNMNWQDIACSMNGKYIVAVEQGTMNDGLIWISTDYGTSWNSKLSGRLYWSCDMSDCGKYIVVGVYNGRIYYSEDFGTTFSEIYNVSNIYRDVSVSGNGQNVLFIPENNNLIVNKTSNNFYSSINTVNNFNRFNITDSGRGWFMGPEDNANSNFVLYNNNNVGAYINYGGTGWIANSDRRIKKNVEDITNSLDIINKLKPVKFHYLNDNDNDNKRFGLIAQDVKEVIPEIVHDNNDILGVSYTDLIPYLLSSVKELSEQIKEIKNILG